MNFLNKINVNYNIKLIEDYLLNKDFNNSLEKLTSLQKKNPRIFYEILLNLDSQFTNLSNRDLYKKKFIWLFSFDDRDSIYIQNFLEYYCNRNLSIDCLFSEYSELISEVLLNLQINSIPKEIDFEYTIHNSSVLQNLVLFSKNKSFFFLRACAAFFEFLEKRKYLIYPNSTLCYFYIVRNPKEIFNRLRNQYQSAEAAMYELFNYGDSLFINEKNKQNKYQYYQNKQSWNINVNSWIDDNVLSSFKGNLINFDDLENNTEETLVNIIFHLKQTGLDIPINYDVISSYVDENPFPKENYDQISNNDKKKLLTNLDKTILEKFKFDI